MIPHFLYIYDFMGHRKSEIDCSMFDSVLIIGKHKNNVRISNATGKTTIFHAIDFVLFDKVPSDTIDEIVRDGCDECCVIFEFFLDKKQYKIERIRRKKTKKSSVRLFYNNNGIWIDISQRTYTETNYEIEKIIGINYKSFKSIQFSQFDLGMLMSTPSEKQKILQEAIGGNIYNKFELESKKYIKTIKYKIKEQDSLKKFIGDPQIDINNSLAEIKKLQLQIKNIKNDKEQYDNLLYNEQLNLNKLQDVYNSDIKQINDKIKSLSINIKNKQDKINNINLLLNNKQNEINKIKNSIIDCEQMISVYKENLDELDCDIEKQSKVKEQINNYINEKNKIKNNIERLNNELDIFQKPIPKGKFCPECKQELNNENIKNIKNIIPAKIKKIQSEIDKKNTLLTSIIKKELECQKTFQIIEDNIKQYGKLNFEIKQKILEKTNNKKILSHLFDVIQQITFEYQNTNEQLEELIELKEESEKIKSFEGELLENIDEKIQLSKSKIQSFKNTINNCLKQIYEYNTIIGIHTEKINVRKNDQKKINIILKKINKLKQMYKIYQVVIRGFNVRGIPTMIINNILDDLQVSINNILLYLKPGLQIQFIVEKNKNDGEFEDTLDIKYIINGKERSSKLLSGGQKFLFALSLRLGLSLIMQKRLGINIKFLELDEVDKSLDKESLDMYANVILKLQKNFKIFVITHTDSLKEKFKHAIVVEGDDINGSTSKVVESW